MKRTTKLIALMLATIMLLCAAVACSAKTDTKTEAGTQEKRYVTILQNVDIQSFDPQAQNDSGSWTVIRHIYDTLVRSDENNALYPCLAESWEFPDDQSILFHLRKGVVFHNGDSMTAEDVKFTLDRAKESAKQKTMIAAYESSEIVDEYTVLVHLNQPCNQVLLNALSRNGCSIVPKSYTENLEASGKSLNEAPIGTGPYKFVSFRAGDRTVMDANENYFGEVKNDGIILRIITDSSAALIAMETGEADMLLEVAATDIDMVRTNSNLELFFYDSTRFEYMGFNTLREPFTDIRVREALMHLVNREDIIKVACNGEATANYGCLAHGAVGYTDDVKHYEYDLELAKKLLAEAGYADGFEVTYYTYGDVRLKVAQVLQASFAQAGITLKIEAMESGPLFDLLDAKEFDLAALSRNSNSPDTDMTVSQLYYSTSTGVASNIWTLQDPECDRLIDEARIQADPAVRKAMYAQLQQRVMELCVICPFYTTRAFVATSSNLKGLTVYRTGMHMFNTLYFEK